MTPGFDLVRNVNLVVDLLGSPYILDLERRSMAHRNPNRAPGWLIAAIITFTAMMLIMYNCAPRMISS